MPIVIEGSRVQRFPVEIDVKAFILAFNSPENLSQLSTANLNSIIDAIKQELENRNG